jgi:DNA helicase HerA-like ATPase
MPKISVGRSEEDQEEHGLNGTGMVGKHLVGENEEAHKANPVYFDVAKPHVVGVFGKRGTGKSYSMGTIAEEIHTADISENLSTIIIDPMGIYWSMRRPNEQDVSILDEWDLKPKGFDIDVYIPKGKTKDFDEKEMPYDDTFTLNPAELTAEEWRMAFALEEDSEQNILLERVIGELDDEFGDEYRIKHILEAVQKFDFDEKTVKALENRFRNAQEWGIFGEESSLDKLTEREELSVVDVSVFGQMSGGTRVQALVVGILAKRILRRRMAARRLEELDEMQGLDRNEMPIVWMFIDEAHEFLPANGETAASSTLLRWVKIGREPGVSLCLCTQQPAKLNPNALSQMDVLLSHRLTARQDIEALGEIMQTYMRYDLKHYIDALPDRKGTGIIMDDNSERIYPVQMRPRKSWHAGGTPDAFNE